MAYFLNSISRRRRTPDNLVISANEQLAQIIEAKISSGVSISPSSQVSNQSNLDKDEDDEANLEQLTKTLIEIKSILSGDTDHQEEGLIKELSLSIQTHNFLPNFIKNMSYLPFESRKDVALIYNLLIRKNIENCTAYITSDSNIEIIKTLVESYNTPDIALSCGLMLKESVKLEKMFSYIFNNDLIWQFFDTYVHLPNFEVASDAFNILKDMLTMNSYKSIIEVFLEKNCSLFLKKYETLLNSENYVTRRRSLQLLSSLLLERSNYFFMITYISSRENLKIIMNLLKSKSTQIQYESFHIFKIFVANPNKSLEIITILYNNKARLISFLQDFLKERDESEKQFVDEKRLLIETLQNLTPPE